MELSNLTASSLTDSIAKLLNRSAVGANDVIVVTASTQFKQGSRAGKINSTDYSGRLKLCKYAIYGAQADALVGLGKASINPVRTQVMRLRGTEDFQDLASGSCDFQTSIDQGAHRC